MVDTEKIFSMGYNTGIPVYPARVDNVGSILSNIDTIKRFIDNDDSEMIDTVGRLLSTLINVEKEGDGLDVIYEVVRDSICIEDDKLLFMVLNHTSEEIIKVYVYVEDNTPMIGMQCSTLLGIQNRTVKENSIEYASILYLRSMIFYVFTIYQFDLLK